MPLHCSWTFIISVVVVGIAIGSASLPMLMSALLRHMFTAPNQQPWPYGSLRLINCSGLPAQPLNSAERIHQINEEFQHKQGDVWIVSYVKSGTTWTIGILASLWDHPAAEYAGNLQKMTRTFCPQPELPDLGWGDDGFGHSIQELNEWPRPDGRRCLKSHWPAQDFVASNNGGKSKFIYVLRNAQDQIISHWNQVWGMGFHYGTQNVAFEDGWDVFVQDWLDGNVENGKWFDHVAGWYKRSQDDPDNVLLIRYEELKYNTNNTIQKIAKFINVTSSSNTSYLNEKDLAIVKDMTSFERMKKADENDMGLKFMRFLGVLRKHHIRQGEIGANELKFKKEHLEALNKEFQNKLQPLGIPKDWVLLD